MNKILISMTLLVASSAVAFASNLFNPMVRDRYISQAQPQRQHFIQNSRVNYIDPRVGRDLGVRVIRANYTPRREAMQHIVRYQPRRVPNYTQPHFRQRVESVPHHFQPNRELRVRPQLQSQIKPQHRPNRVSHNRFLQAKRAADRGNPQAEFDLAMMYATGNGVRKDPRTAFNLFHRAARKGNVEAKYCMGVNFEKGLGVIKQHELAHHWYSLAAKAGSKKAQRKLAQIDRNLNQRATPNRYARNEYRR